MKKLFLIKGIITATAKDGSEARATCEVTVKNMTNYKSAYTISDYYQWDAYAPADKTDTGTWEPESSHYHEGDDNVIATQSCKGICDLETAMLYLSEDVYWDEKGPAYNVDGSEYKTGLWVKKHRFLAKDAKGQKDRTPIKLSTLNSAQQTVIRRGGDYFFLPAAGYCYDSSFDDDYVGEAGDYWLSTPCGGLDFTSEYAFVNCGYNCSWHELLRLVVE